jgi:acyl-CoA hydrolase
MEKEKAGGQDPDDIRLDELRARYPEKFVGEQIAFRKINAGARIFIGTGCGEPQYLVAALIKYVE